LNSFQSLYCSKLCRETDWSRAHEGICNKHSPYVAEPENFDIFESVSDVPPSLTVLIHLIGRIGLENIKQTALQNPSMPFLLGDPRTKGFHNGKFQEATLEAFLSLGDMFDSLPGVVKFFSSSVSNRNLHLEIIPYANLFNVAVFKYRLSSSTAST
jgi:hypothetical protein